MREPMTRKPAAADSELSGIELVHVAKAWESLLTKDAKE